MSITGVLKDPLFKIPPLSPAFVLSRPVFLSISDEQTDLFPTSHVRVHHVCDPPSVTIVSRAFSDPVNVSQNVSFKVSGDVRRGDRGAVVTGRPGRGGGLGPVGSVGGTMCRTLFLCFRKGKRKKHILHYRCDGRQLPRKMPGRCPSLTRREGATERPVGSS